MNRTTSARFLGIALIVAMSFGIFGAFNGWLPERSVAESELSGIQTVLFRDLGMT
jgi:hypothetical protein